MTAVLTRHPRGGDNTPLCRIVSSGVWLPRAPGPEERYICWRGNHLGQQGWEVLGRVGGVQAVGQHGWVWVLAWQLFTKCVIWGKHSVSCPSASSSMKWDQRWPPLSVVPVIKNPLTNARDLRDAGLIPGSRSSPGGEHSNPVQYSCLENPKDRGSGGLQSIGSQRVGHD